MEIKEVEEIISTLNEYIPTLIEGIQSICEDIYSNKMQDELTRVTEVVEGIQWVSQAVILTSQYHDYLIDETEIKNSIIDLVKAYENSDSVLALDVLKYEILPILKELV